MALLAVLGAGAGWVTDGDYGVGHGLDLPQYGIGMRHVAVQLMNHPVGVPQRQVPFDYLPRLTRGAAFSPYDGVTSLSSGRHFCSLWHPYGSVGYLLL